MAAKKHWPLNKYFERKCLPLGPTTIEEFNWDEAAVTVVTLDIGTRVAVGHGEGTRESLHSSSELTNRLITMEDR